MTDVTLTTSVDTETQPVDRDIAWLQEGFQAISGNARKVIRGKRRVVEFAALALLSEGHVLLEDVPGVGKTSLARALSLSIDGKWSRIQFTPDLLPSDVTGVEIYDPGTARLHFRPGPVFANIVVADEINRASPKTQSALLEVMEERQVTVDIDTHPVPRPFVVIATQNPIELSGTYRLPEAQLDRFMMKLSLGYPSQEAEVEVLAAQLVSGGLADLRSVVTLADVQQMIAITSRVHVSPAVQDYIVRISRATRAADSVRIGVSPRGSVALLRASQSLAAASGRSFVLPEDVKTLAPNVLSHRILLKPTAELDGRTTWALVETVLESVPQPEGRG